MRVAKYSNLLKQSHNSLKKRWEKLRTEQKKILGTGDLPKYLSIQREMTKTAKAIDEIAEKKIRKLKLKRIKKKR